MKQKVRPFNIPKPDSSSLIFQVDKAGKFYDQLHQHQEAQLSMILKGEGELIIGDAVGHYVEGDVFLIGGNVPHLFRSNTEVASESQMLTLFFTLTSFGDDFFQLAETKGIAKLLDGSVAAYKLEGRKKGVEDLFRQLSRETRLGKFILFLKIMNVFTRSKKQILTSTFRPKRFSEDQGSRMSDVMTFAMNEFHRDIKLSEVAELANMTVNAFCRFFKNRTNKTFVQLLNEIRLEHACNLLLKQRDMSIADIATQSGFNNISNFNRKFKQYKKTTPTNFRGTF